MEYNEKSGFHLVLIFFYLLLLEISLIQLFRLIYNRHQIVSFQFGFLTISFIWCAERIFSLVFSPLISTELFQFLWVLPSFFQFLSFSLLVFYNRFLLLQHRWAQTRFVSILVYVITNITLLIITIFLAYFTSVNSSYLDRVKQFYNIWFTFLFTILLIVYAYYGYKLRQASSNANWAQQKASTLSQLYISIIAWCIFFTRWLYYVFATLSPNTFALFIKFGDDGIADVPWPTLLVLIVWEIAPTTLVLFVSRDIPINSETNLGVEIKKNGLFFCFKKNTNVSSIYGNFNQLNQNLLTNSYDDSFDQQQLHGNNLIYLHQASYEVLNEGDHDITPDNTTNNNNDDDDEYLHKTPYDDHHHHHHHHHHHSNSFSREYMGGFGGGRGVINGLDGLDRSQHEYYQERLQQQLHQVPSSETVGGGAATSTQRIQPAGGDRGGKNNNGFLSTKSGDGGNNLAKSAKQSSSRQQQPHGASQLLQMQLQSQLQSHLAQYGGSGGGGSDDGGDLF